MSEYVSNYLNQFVHDIKVSSVKKRDVIWADVKTPIIEIIPTQAHQYLVTFLYRLPELEKNTDIFLLSQIIKTWPFTKESRLIHIPETDIAYLSFILPSTLRTVYNFLRVDKKQGFDLVDETSSDNTFYPTYTGKYAAIGKQIMQLAGQGCLECDQRNPNEIAHYQDINNSQSMYDTKSILELSMAPCLDFIPTSFESIKDSRNVLLAEKRLIESVVHFANTSLKDIDGYYGSTAQATRKYWIYFPAGYDQNTSKSYPLMLFLDGGDYLSTIPAHCILDKMIDDKIIPACIAIFFESANDHQRANEYICHDEFIHFLANDFIEILRNQHRLNITRDPKLTTIIGLSWGGLAAFYAGLTAPDVFGNVIAQSPSFEMMNLIELKNMMGKFCEKNKQSNFTFDVGTYETTPIEVEFKNGTIQSTIIFEVVQFVCVYLKQKNVEAAVHNFIGGHNDICWRISLYDRIKEVYQHRIAPS